MPTPDAAAAPRPSPRRRRLRRALAWLAAGAALVLAAGWLALRPATLGRFIAWRLSAMVGGEVTIERAEYLGDGALRIVGFRLQAPGWKGPAGQIAAVDEIRTVIDMGALWSLRVAPREVELGDATVRIAERIDAPNQLNLFALDPPDSAVSAVGLLPRIEVGRATIEVGARGLDGAWLPRGTIRVTGELRNDAGAARRYAVRLDEIDADGARPQGGIDVRGSFDRGDQSAEFTLGALTLNDRLRDLLPSLAREWWIRMDLRGELERGTIVLHEGRPVSAELVVGASQLTVPVDTGLTWMVVHAGRMAPTATRPRVRVTQGTIRLEGRSATLENVQGRIVGMRGSGPRASVPLRVDLTIPDLPELTWRDRAEWLDEALASTAFEARVELFDFSVGRRRADEGIELPYVIADIIDAFRLSNWSMSAELRLHRGAPVWGPDGAIRTQEITYEGQALLANASIEYERFPYALSDVSGRITFTQDAIEVESLRGRGSGEGTLLVTGRVAPPGPGSGFDLRVIGNRFPVDDRLKAALPKAATTAVDLLLSQPAIEGLGAAGLLLDDAALRAARTAADAALAATTPETPAWLAARGALRAAEGALSVGPIHPGGAIDFEVRVQRDVGGPTMPMSLTGTIPLTGVGCVFEEFPYPFRIERGAIHLEENGVTLGDGIDLVTAGGGRGRVEGRVDLPKGAGGEMGFHPDLTVTVVEDHVSALLLAAIPPSREDLAVIAEEGRSWPASAESDVARLLGASAFRGTIDARATIGVDPAGGVAWRSVVTLAEGSAMPTEQTDEMLASAAFSWPDELAARDLAATVSITPDGVEITGITGRAGNSPVTGSASVDVAEEPPAVALQVALDDLPIAPWMVELAPAEDRPDLESLWERLDPAGLIDASIALEVDDGPASAVLLVAPQVCEATMSGQRVQARTERGDLRLGGSGIELRDLAFLLTTDGTPNGEVLLDGDLPDGDSRGWMRGEWRDARFECPVILETLRELGLDEALTTAETLRPAGEFEARFSAEFAADGTLEDYRIAVEPGTLDVDLGGERLEATFEDGGSLTATPGHLALAGLRGTHGEGSFFVEGGGTLGPSAALALDVEAESATLGPDLRALLPEAVREAMAAMQLRVDGGISADGRVELERRSGAWWGRWDGPIRVREAALDAGLALTEVSGTLAIDASGGGGAVPAMRTHLALDRIRVVGRRVDTAAGVIELDEAGEHLRLRSLHGGLYGGVAVLDGSVDLDDERDYDLELVMAGVGVTGLALSRGVDPGAPGSLAEGADGRIEGRLGLAGRSGDPGSRRGVGAMRIVDARMAEMPLTLAMLQLSQLMLPLNASLSSGEFDYYILGDLATFERISLRSDTLSLDGHGELDLETLELSARLATRGNLPFLSDLMSPLSNNIFAIALDGPLADPSARVIPLPMLEAILPAAPVARAATASSGRDMAPLRPIGAPR